MRYFLLALFGLSLLACSPKWQKALKEQQFENPATQEEKDQNKIITYALENEWPFQRDSSGIYYHLLSTPTSTEHPSASDIVIAHYKGELLDGKVFDSSYDREEPLNFTLGGVIKGWQIAIPKLSRGQKGVFLIPSHLAYGERGAGKDIPPNSVLRFEIELIDFYSKEEAAERQAKEEQEKITKYLAENNMSDYDKTDSGIYYKIERPGDQDAKPTTSDKITAHYTGRLLDGKEFDSSVRRGEPLVFNLSGVIPGWQQAIPMLGKGGKGTFVIPSKLAYGPRGAGGVIPPNAPLVFEIELIDF